MFGDSFGLFSIFPVLFLIAFVFIFSMVIYIFIKNARSDAAVRKSPRLTVPATIVSKRTAIRHHTDSTINIMTYYITFEFESGDRLELKASGENFGLLVEGDHGKVTFQGNLLLGFERDGSLQNVQSF